MGGEVLRYALDHPAITEVTELARRPTRVDHPKLTKVIVEDFLDLATILASLAGAALCCHCLAVYIHRTGRAAYRVATVDYLASLLRTLEAASPKATFCMFTTEGACPDGTSWIRTMNVKGEAERLALASRLPRRFVFRPGYIYPTRPRARPLIYDLAMRPIFRLFPAIGIEAAALARAMLETGLHDTRATATIENREIREIARRIDETKETIR